MSADQDIITAVTALGVFAKVRYIVAEADSDLRPTDLPLCVLSDGGKDFSDFKTFCGSGDLFTQTFDMLIIAKTAREMRDLTAQVSNALIGIVALDSVSESFDSDLRAYVAEIELS